MKKLVLKQIIKEEISKVLKEGLFNRNEKIDVITQRQIDLGYPKELTKVVIDNFDGEIIRYENSSWKYASIFAEVWEEEGVPLYHIFKIGSPDHIKFDNLTRVSKQEFDEFLNNFKIN